MGTTTRQTHCAPRTGVVTALCLTITCLPLSVYGSASSHMNITYDSISHRLHLSCQHSDNNFLYMILLRLDTGTTLANLTRGDKGLALHERVTVNNAAMSTHILEAVLSHVTCFDLGHYSCYILADPPKQSAFIFKETKVFSNAGVVRTLKIQPLQSRYAVGTTVHLTCTADVWLADHPIVWETRLPGEQYQTVIAIESASSNPAENADKFLCGGSTTSSITHTLNSDDDNREWRCRLHNTSDGLHQTTYIVAVQTDSDGCVPSTTPKETSSVNTMQDLLVSEWPPHDTVSETNINKNFSASEERGDSSHILMLTLVVITAILLASTFLSLVIMAAIVKKRPERPDSSPICHTPSSHCNEYTSPFPDSTLPPSPTNHYLQPHEQESLESGEGEAEETALKDPPPDLMTCSPSSSVYITNLTTLLQSRQHSSLLHCQDPASCQGHCLYYNQELPDNQRNNIINQHPSTIVTRGSCSRNSSCSHNNSCVCCSHFSKSSNATYTYKCSICSPVTMERLK